MASHLGPHFTIVSAGAKVASKVALTSLKPDEIAFLQKVDDLEELMKAGSFHQKKNGVATQTGSFAKSLVSQFRTQGNLTPNQRMWVRVLLDRALIGPENFPPAQYGKMLGPACKGCGTALTSLTKGPHKGLCKTCVRKYDHD